MNEIRNIFDISGRAMSAQLTRLNTVASNLANANNVSGSMEKPLALKSLLQKPTISGAIALGIIENGQTAHGRVMAEAVFKTILDLQLEMMKPIGVGILGPEINKEQIQVCEK